MATSHARGGGLRRLSIVALLVGAVVILHRFAPDHTGGAPSTMLAFGFVVLSSYAVGQLVEVIKLPHITGYLLAGLLLGPSFAGLIPASLAVPPFDRGLLRSEVITGLSVLDTLAVALIALTAGGALKVAALRAGIRTLLSLLAAQGALVLPAVAALTFLVSGAIPSLTLPMMPPVAPGAAAAMAVAVATIAYATSPAAVLAVIAETGAEGPTTRTLLSSVVLKDIVVVILFSVASVYATAALGVAALDAGLGQLLVQRVLGSLLVGGVLGVVVSLYLRYVDREILLFLVALVYTATLLARALELDPVLLFIAAGFAASNIAREADRLLAGVERLSLPVYVVFFTLAGARLHLDHVAMVAPHAVALFLVRALAFRGGTRLGARLGGGTLVHERHGWMAYLPQAGVAISLTGLVGARLGEPGRALETLLISVIALNELVGPVLLKVSLSLAGETAERRLRAAGGASPASHADERAAERLEAVGADVDPWAPRHPTSSRALAVVAQDLERDLRGLVKRADDAVLAPLLEEAEEYLRELRGELLRLHRRVAVQLRTEARSALEQLVRTQRAEVANRWRAIALGRSARVRAREVELGWLLGETDRLIDQLPEWVAAPVEERAVSARPEDGPRRALQRRWLRLRRRLAAAVGGAEPEREVPVRAMAAHHLTIALGRLEAVAALIVQTDHQLASRTRSLFDAVLRGYDALAEASRDEAVDLAESLRALHEDLEAELEHTQGEVARLHQTQRRRLAGTFARALHALEAHLAVGGTPDRPSSRAQARQRYTERAAALELLGPRLAGVSRMASARFGSLALELELLALEARTRDALHQHAGELVRDVRGRTFVQAERVIDALDQALRRVEALLADHSLTGDALGRALRDHTEALESCCAEGARAAQQLSEQLADEQAVRPLLDALRRTTRELTDVYTVPAARIEVGEWRLPPPVEAVEVDFREMVSAMLEAEVAPRLIIAAREAGAVAAPLAQALTELERRVAFNNELARGELEVVREAMVPARTREILAGMFVGALARSRESLEAQRRAAEGWDAALSGALSAAVTGATDQLRRSLVDGEQSRLRFRALRPVGAGRRLIARATGVPRWIEGARAQLRHSVRVALGDERLDRWRRGLGLPNDANAREPTLTPPRPSTQLPLFYARLFAADALEAADVLTGREASIEAARRALLEEVDGRTRAVALVGPDGVGKATLSAAIVRGRGWKAVRRHNFGAPASSAEIEAMFRDRGEGHLNVVSGFHWLLSTRPGGFARVRRFVEGVLEDGGRNAYLVHADSLVWRLATQVAPLEDAFPEVIHLDALGPRELEAAVLARHALSSYRVDLGQVAVGVGLASVPWRAELHSRRPHAAYFRALHAASGGLVRDALRLWLASIDRVDEASGTVVLGALPRSTEPAIRALPDEVMIELYQVARQGWMDADTFAWCFGVGRVAAEARLAHLARMGLLERERLAYRIAPHLRGPVHRVLTERRWV